VVVVGFLVVAPVDHFAALDGYFVASFVQRYFVHQVVKIAWQLIETVKLLLKLMTQPLIFLPCSTNLLLILWKSLSQVDNLLWIRWTTTWCFPFLHEATITSKISNPIEFSLCLSTNNFDLTTRPNTLLQSRVNRASLWIVTDDAALDLAWEYILWNSSHYSSKDNFQ